MLNCDASRGGLSITRKLFKERHVMLVMLVMLLLVNSVYVVGDQGGRRGDAERIPESV